MTRIVEIDPREITVTPVFMIIELENVPKSEAAGHLVMETREVVEVRFAGSKNYSPRFPTDEFWKREGNQVITYAERWPDQYRQFKEGNPQEANGTPLEMLRPHGVTPEQLSLCRALKIYSIEALYHLEGQALKSLGMSANMLKEAARAFLADRDKGLNALDEVAKLRAELAALKAGISTQPPAQESPPQEIEQAVETADKAYTEMSANQLKDVIEAKVGVRPSGNPTRDVLLNTLQELEKEAA